MEKEPNPGNHKNSCKSNKIQHDYSCEKIWQFPIQIKDYKNKYITERPHTKWNKCLEG